MKEIVRIFAFANKELRTVLRQKRLVATLVLGPFLILLLFGVGFRGGQSPVRGIVVIPPEMSAEQDIQEFQQKFSSGAFVIQAISQDSDEAQRQLDRREVDAVIVLPENAFDSMLDGQPANIDVLINEINPVRRSWIDYNTFVAISTINKSILTETVREGRSPTQRLGEMSTQLNEQSNGIKQSIDSNDVPGATVKIARMKQDVEIARAAAAEALGSLTLAGRSLGAKTTATVVARVTDHLNKIESDLNGVAAGMRTNDPTGGAQHQRVAALQTNTAALKTDADKVVAIPPEIFVSPLSAKTKNLAAVDATYIAFYAPAVIALLLQHLAISLIALSIVRERLLGAMEIFRVSPVSTLTIVLGKSLAFAAVSLAIGGVLVILVNRGLDVPFFGDIRNLWISLAILVFASLGLGFLFGTISRTENQAVQLTMLSLIASTFFGGFFIALDQLQPFARVLSYILPVTYGIRNLQDVMLGGLVPAPMFIAGPLVLGLVCYIVATIVFRQQLRPS